MGPTDDDDVLDEDDEGLTVPTLLMVCAACNRRGGEGECEGVKRGGRGKGEVGRRGREERGSE